MDKKNTIIGVLLLGAAFATFFIGNKLNPPSAPQPTREISTIPGGNQATEPASVTSPVDAAFVAVSKEVEEARTWNLGNDFIEVSFTNQGGAIREVALRNYDEEKVPKKEDRKSGPYVINRLSAAPALAFLDLPGLDRNTTYSLVSSSDTEIVFRAIWENRIEVIRRYTLSSSASVEGSDPYLVRYSTTLRNLSDATIRLPRLNMSVGTAAPLNAADPGMYLSTGYGVGGDSELIKRSELEGGGFLSWIGMGSKEPLPYIESGGPLAWASVQNQFFTTILTPDQPAASMNTRRIELPAFPGTVKPAVGMVASAAMEVPALAPGAIETLSGSFYAGPKEYKRLSNIDVFKVGQDGVMDFGFFSFFSKILLTLMTWIHQGVPSWGWSIVLTTLLLKVVFLPLTLAASKSAKRMSKIQPEMQAVREKFKDNPQKLQLETMELFKKHKVNPMGGCLPILITIPFFIGFFQMLQSTAELRFQEFLWAVDLSAPDTIAHVFGLPINIMPILMGATMVIQMNLTPTPTVDNMQAKMMKFMPYFFALICYNFSCALALYSTVNGLFTIAQQLVINRMKDPVGDAAEAALAEEARRKGRRTKNVTPRK